MCPCPDAIMLTSMCPVGSYANVRFVMHAPFAPSLGLGFPASPRFGSVTTDTLLTPICFNVAIQSQYTSRRNVAALTWEADEPEEAGEVRRRENTKR